MEGPAQVPGVQPGEEVQAAGRSRPPRFLLLVCLEAQVSSAVRAARTPTTMGICSPVRLPPALNSVEAASGALQRGAFSAGKDGVQRD